MKGSSTADGESKWLEAHYDPVASLSTFSQCITYCDISADGDSRLIIADLGSSSYDMKLKVYKGTDLVSENVLIDVPTGLVTFYMDQLEPRAPAIAVASGPFVYVYKNLRPYFKFTVPQGELSDLEKDIWDQAKDDRVDHMTLRETLEGIHLQGAKLSNRSLLFLGMETSKQATFVEEQKNSAPKCLSVLTCLGTLKKCMAEDDAVSCLVLGSENGRIYIVDPEAFTILKAVTLPSTPVFLSINGLFDVEYRIVVACRNGIIYNLKRSTDDVKSGIHLNSQPVGMVRVGRNIIVACMDDTLRCYTTKGKRLWLVQLPASVLCMTIMDHEQKAFKAVLVALSNKQVHLYRDKFLVNVMETKDAVGAMIFGRFGRELGALTMVLKGGGLLIRILKRSASFEERSVSAGPPPEQNLRLDVPKKTRLYVDQTSREREHYKSMHQQFQQDLFRLRLFTAESYLESLERGNNPVSANPDLPLKLNAHVTGIGPLFKLSVNLQNTSEAKALHNLLVTFKFDPKLYNVRKLIFTPPLLVPGTPYLFETFVDSLSDKGIADTIKVFVVEKGKSVPVITAVINMPVSEPVSAS